MRRSYGTGSLYTRADKNGRETWYGLWWTPEGRRVKRRLAVKRSRRDPGGLTPTKAEAELRRLMRADRGGDRAAPPVSSQRSRETEASAATGLTASDMRLPTIAEAGDVYVEHLALIKERKRTTIADYRGYLRVHLVPYFGERPIADIHWSEIEAYILAKKRAGYASTTVLKHLTFLGGMYRFSIKREWASTNPVTLADRPKAPRWKHRRLRFLSVEELEAVIRAVPDDELGAMERVLYRTAAMTGLRQGELLALRWSDIDWAASRVRVAESYSRGAFDTPKSHQGRSVPMADSLAAELEHHFTESDWQDERDLVFAHPITGHVADASKIRKRFRDAVRRAGVPDLTFHELRHTFGTRMAAVGAPIRSLQAWMGHADASTTEIYTHYAADLNGERLLVERAFAQPGRTGQSPRR